MVSIGFGFGFGNFARNQTAWFPVWKKRLRLNQTKLPQHYPQPNLWLSDKVSRSFLLLSLSLISFCVQTLYTSLSMPCVKFRLLQVCWLGVTIPKTSGCLVPVYLNVDCYRTINNLRSHSRFQPRAKVWDRGEERGPFKLCTGKMKVCFVVLIKLSLRLINPSRNSLYTYTTKEISYQLGKNE